MKRHSVVTALAVLAVTVVAIGAGAVARSDVSVAQDPAGDEAPAALARHLEEREFIQRLIPGSGGLSEGPGSWAEEQFLQLAFPLSDIPLAEVAEARADAARHNRKASPSGRKWASLGPTNALYQHSPFRTGYVPTEYSAAGRTTALALAPGCTRDRCHLYAAAAGGGVWRTDNALARAPRWKFLSPDFALNAVGALMLDPNDRTGNTVYAGTGEANACGVCVAGTGLYKSTNGGDSWTGPLGADVFGGRAIGSIAIHPTDPNTLYVSTTRGVRGVSSSTGGAVSLIPGAPKWGLYKTTDGGASWSFIHNGAATTAGCLGTSVESSGGTPCSPRGVRRVRLDPSNPDIVYASSYARGVWRSNDGGATWTQIRQPQNNTTANSFTDRAEFDVAALPNGKTRMYVGEGSTGGAFGSARFARSDDVSTGAPVFTEITIPVTASPRWATTGYCDAQCWYDNYVISPDGHPDIVYVAGDHAYGESIANFRGVLLSTDAGETFTDMTEDATDATHPNGLHPDHHDLAVIPGSPFRFFEASDGGVVRSSGEFANISTSCNSRGLVGPDLERCRQMLSRVPTRLESINRGYMTIQFMSLSVNPFDVTNLQGGTQDNGTFETKAGSTTWPQSMWGDGGQSGFDAANRNFRFHTFFTASPEVNFNSGAVPDWIWIGDPLFLSQEPQAFYIPIISDPKVSETMYAGLSHVWRTKTAGQGSMTDETFNDNCNTHTGAFILPCGDWQPLAADAYAGAGPPSPESRLTDVKYGLDRTGGTIAAVERAPSDTSTLWAATSTGRVFVSKNADAELASTVVFQRIDTTPTADPNRFISSIYVDPANSNHAWLSYSGFNGTTPATPGHVFEVTFDPVTGTATWTSRDGDLGDVPVTDLVRDDLRGDLYAATDYGVLRLASGAATWTPAGAGLPTVVVAGLTIVPSARTLYAASHGLGAWSLTLP